MYVRLLLLVAPVLWSCAELLAVGAALTTGQCSCRTAPPSGSFCDPVSRVELRWQSLR